MDADRFFTRLLLASAGLLMSCQVLAQTTHTVQVMDNFFSPSNLEIEVGDTVRWENAPGGNPHNVTSDTGAWAPSGTATQFNFEVTFNDPGDFPYECTVHFGMDGNITVTGQAAAAEIRLQSVNAENGSYKEGDMMGITSMIRNTGDADSGNFMITYYASADENITSGDHMLGSEQVGNVPAGMTIEHNGEIAWPTMIPPDSYFIGAIISFADSNQANNTDHDGTAVVYLAVFKINAGLNDAWLNFATGGQGFFFVVFPEIEMFFLAYFTFDTERPDETLTAVIGEPYHRWVTAFGGWDGNTVTLDVELTEGGIFDSEDPPVEQTPGYGTMTIVFHDCNNATLTYDFPSLGLSGSIELTRVTPDNIELCRILNAELQAGMD